MCTSQVTDKSHTEYFRVCLHFITTDFTSFWFGLMLYVPVNSYGHVWTVSLPNHTFFLGKFD